MSPEDLLQLQRTIGNRGVNGIIQRSALADKITGNSGTTTPDSNSGRGDERTEGTTNALVNEISGEDKSSASEDGPLDSGVFIPPTLGNILLPDDQLPSKTKSDLGPGDCLLGNVFFRTDEATLDNLTDQSALDNLVIELERLMADGHTPQLEIIGYADPRYTDEHNQQLSQRRAEAVKNYLENRLGVGGLIIAIGDGEIKDYQGADPLTQAHARRVDIRDHALCHASKNEDADKPGDEPEDYNADQTTSTGSKEFDFRILGGFETKITWPGEEGLPKGLKALAKKLKKGPSWSLSLIEMDVEFHDGVNRVKQQYSVELYVLTANISLPSPPVSIIKPSGPYPVDSTEPVLFCEIEGEVTYLESTVFGQGGNGLEFLGPTPRITILMSSDTFKTAIEGKGGVGSAVRKGGQIRAGSGGVNWHDC